MMQKPTQVSPSPSPPKFPRKCRRSAFHSSHGRASINMGKTNPAKEHKCKELDESSPKDFGHGKQENAIVGEVQEQDKGSETTSRRVKRSRCMYSLENGDVSKKSAHSQSIEFPPLLSRVDEDSLKPSSKSTECDSSASNSEDRDGNQESEPSSGKKLKLTEELKSPNLNDKDRINTETRDCLDLEAEDGTMEIVQLTVSAGPRGENIPFVSLTSEAYGIAVMGYPLDVGEIRDGSDTSSLSKESVECNLLGGQVNRFDKLVWRKSRRTPVCYVNVKSSKLQPQDNSPLRKETSLTKNTKQCNQEKTAKNKSCVPVKVIFSKILAEVD